jgi:calcium-dependent protein kinase
VKKTSSLEQVYGNTQQETTDKLTKSPRSNAAFNQKLVRDTAATEEGIKLFDVYSFVNEGNIIGEGSNATIRLVMHKVSKRKFALKTIESSKIKKEDQAQLWREVELIRALDHPNIIKIVETFTDDKGDFHLVLPYCAGGDLFDYLLGGESPRLPEEEVWGFAKNMVGALQYMYKNNVVHRDIKLENFVFSSKEEGASLVLVDFGFSRTSTAGDVEIQKSIGRGTLYTMAPELVDETNENEIDGYKADLWAVGVVLYCLLYGSYPYGPGNSTNEKTTSDILTKNPPFPPSIKVSKRCKSLLVKIFEKDPLKRLTAEQALNDAWLKNPPRKIGRMDSRSTAGVREQRRLSHVGKRGVKREKREKTKTVIEQMKLFKTYGVFKKMALLAVAQSMDHERISKLTDAFAVFDLNDDGTITWNEFCNILRQNGFVTGDQTELELKEIFKYVDQDCTGFIKYTEFIAACMDNEEYTDETAVQEAFRRLDIDRKGGITKSNLMDLLKGKLPYGVSDSSVDEAVDRIFAEADTNNDGVIDVRELNLVLNNDSKKDGWTDDGEGSRASRPSIGSTTSSDSCEPMDVLSSSS